MHAQNPIIPMLPDDIIACITDQVHDDIDTLKACALVSTTWVHPSRCHLFRSAVVRSSEDGQRFSQFLAFLKDHRAISGYIRRFSLVSLPQQFPKKGNVKVELSLLADLLSILDMAKDVEFRGVIFSDSESDSESAILLSPSLELDRVVLADIVSTSRACARILSLLSPKQLHIRLSRFSDFNTPSGPWPSAKIPSLTLRHVQPSTLTCFLPQTLELSYVSSLSIAIYDHHHFLPLTSVLETHGVGLEELHLDLSTVRRPSRWQPFRLTSCTSLTSLSFLLHLGHHYNIRFADLVDFLTHSPPRLQYLTISLDLYPSWAIQDSKSKQIVAINICAEDCERVEAVILENCVEMKSLVFDLKDVTNPSVFPRDAWDIIETNMSKLRQKGILSIHPRL